MDLELGLKITKTRDDIASISEYRLAKAGPIFQSRETNTMFILTAHLKGYKRNDINIKIGEDSSKISISGEKPIQDILMMGWLMHRKEVDVAGFNKVFKIPDGVKLDGINAKYDEEEWTLNIFMPKLVKGICGAKIEEIKEESERGRSEQEKSEADQVFSSVGETSKKGSKESEVQTMQDSKSFTEKKEGGVSDMMLDDANRETTKEKIQKEVEESKLGTEDGNGESFRGKSEMEGYEVMKTSKLEEKLGGGTSQKIGDTSQKEIEETRLRIADAEVKGKGKEVGKTAYEAVKSLETEKNVCEAMPRNIGDTSQDKEFEVREMEDIGGFVEKEDKVVNEKVLHDDNGNIIGEVIQKEREESKSGIEDRDGESWKEKIGKAGYKAMELSEMEQNVGAQITQNIGDTSQGFSADSATEQVGKAKRTVCKMERKESGENHVEFNVSTEGDIFGESKQKQFGESKPETEDRQKESSMELKETMKEQKSSNIGSQSQEEFKKSKIQQMEKIKSVEENMDGGESERMPVEASKDAQKHIFGESIQRDIKMPEIETEDGDEEYDGEKAGKENFDSMISIRGEFPKQLPKATVEGSNELGVSEMQEAEHVKEAKIERNPKETKYFADKGEGEESKRMHMKANKDSTKETMQEIEDVSEAKVKREDKEVDYFLEEDEGEEPKRMHMEVKKDLKTEIIQETEDVKKVKFERKDKEVDNFAERAEKEEASSMHIEAKDLKKETMQKIGDVKEANVKRKDKENNFCVNKDEGKEQKKMHMEAKIDLKKVIMQESEDDKETIGKRKGKESKNFVDKGEKKPKIMLTEAKKDLTTETVQESEDVKEEMITTEGKKVIDDGGEDEEPNKINFQAKKDLKKETRRQSEDKEAMIKRKGKETEKFAVKGEGKEPKQVHMNIKDLNAEAIQESEDIREAMVNRERQKMEYFVDEGEGKEPKRLHMKTKIDSTEATQESKDVEEATVKREGKDGEYILDDSEDKDPNRMHREAKKDLAIETMQESEDVKEATVNRKDKDIECFVDHGEGNRTERIHGEVKKDLTKETKQESEYFKEVMVKRKGKDIDYSVDKGKSEVLKRRDVEAKKDIAKETKQENTEKIKNGNKGSDQQDVLGKIVKGKFEVSTEDGSKGFKVAKMEEQNEMEAMAEAESLIERVKGEKSKKTEEAGKAIQKNPVTGILQKETDKSNIERKSKDGPYVSDNMIKVIFELLGTIHAKLPKQVFEAIAQNKERNEYATVKLKGDGSINMHIEQNEDETDENNEKEIRKPKLKSSSQISEEENVDVGVFDGNKRPNFPEMGVTKDIKKDKAIIEGPVVKLNTIQHEKIQVEEGGLRKNITRESAQKERKGLKIQTMEKDQHLLLEEMSKGRYETSKAATEEYPMKIVDSVANKRHGIKGTKIDEAKVAKEELAKRRREEKKIDFKEKDAEIEQFVKKTGEKYEKNQVEAKGGSGEDITMGKDRQANTKTREFPFHLVDSLAKTREATKDKEMEELAKRKSERTDVESTVLEKVQNHESGRISMIFKQVPKDKHPKVLEVVGSPKGEFQSTNDTTTGGKEVKVGFKEVEQDSAKDKTLETKLLPIKTQSKETHKPKNEGVKQDSIKPEKATKFEGQQCTYNIETTKEVARFPSTQQTKVEEKDKLYEGDKAKASTESQKGDLRKDMKNLIEIKDKEESKQKKALKPEIPPEKHLKKGEPDTRNSEFAKGRKIRETMQEETKLPKEKIVDRDQQYVQRNVSKGVGKVDTIGNQMPEKEYVANVGPVAKMMEMKRDLKETPERERHKIAQIVKEKKPRIQEENIKADVEKVEKKGYKTKAVEGMLIGDHIAEVIPEKKRGRPKVAKIEEAKEAPKLPLEREIEKTTQIEDKPTIREITPKFEQASGFKKAAEKMHESHGREYQRDLEEVTPKMEVKPPEMTPKKGVEKSKKEEMSPVPIAIQREEPHELSLPSKHYKIPKTDEVQPKEEGKGIIHALEATTSKEEELSQVTVTQSKAKTEIDEPQAIQRPSPSIQMSSKELHELHTHCMKEYDSHVDNLVNMQEGGKSIHSIKGNAASEVVADEVPEPSKFSSSSSTQPLEVNGKDKEDTSHDEESQDSEKDSKIDGQEATKDETDEDVEQRETLQLEFSEDQQCINENQEDRNGTHEIEEEKSYEQRDKANQEDSQLLQEQKECEEEATGGKKNDKKKSKKLFVSLIIGGPALIASGIFLFIRHRRSNKGGK